MPKGITRRCVLWSPSLLYFEWPLNQLDVVTAFLSGMMKEKEYYAVLEGVAMDGGYDYFELLKAIYGHKQASRVWKETFDEFKGSDGLQVLAFDPCLYIKLVVVTAFSCWCTWMTYLLPAAHLI